MTRPFITFTHPSTMTKLLAIALVIVTLLPIVIFATDFTNSEVVRASRQAAFKRAGVNVPEDTPEARRARVHDRRAKIQPTVGTVFLSVTIQFVILTAMAVVGRRLFALRL